MVCPSLISPLACARAPPAMRLQPSATAAPSQRNFGGLTIFIFLPFERFNESTTCTTASLAGASTLLPEQPVPDPLDEPGNAAGHQVHEADEEYTVDRPRRGLRDLVGH